MIQEKGAQRISLILLGAYLILGLNLFRMQILKWNYYFDLSEKNRLRVVYLEGTRGKVFDRNGLMLATSRLSFNCSVVPRQARKTIVQSCEAIGTILGIDPNELEKRFQKKKPGAYNSVLLAQDITQTQAMAIEERLDNLPGFMIETRPQREYPFGEAAAHIIGYTGPMTEGEIDELEDSGYRAADWIGREGIERSQESFLRGYSGGIQMEVDSRGRMLRAMGVKEPREGKDIELTIDAKLQAYVQKLLSGQKGAVIVMELGEGGILSMNSTPTFDPNLFASALGRKEIGKYFTDSNAPLVNRAIRGAYPAGSIFKIVTAMAALDRHKITPSTSVNCPGHLIVGGIKFRCARESGHGAQALTEAFAHSCNVYFYTIGLWAGADAIYEKAVAFGFARATGIDLPQEKDGFVPSKEWKKFKRHEAWFEGDTANLAIGQGSLQITPVQALDMVAVVASDGLLYRPHLVNKINGVKVGERQARKIGLDIDHLQMVKRGLDAVVNTPTGTGRLAQTPGMHIAGKTGTAQSGKAQNHAWFVSYAPFESPKIAVCVFLEHGGHGGVEGAKIAHWIYNWLGSAGYL